MPSGRDVPSTRKGTVTLRNRLLALPIRLHTDYGVMKSRLSPDCISDREHCSCRLVHAACYGVCRCCPPGVLLATSSRLGDSRQVAGYCHVAPC